MCRSQLGLFEIRPPSKSTCTYRAKIPLYTVSVNINKCVNKTQLLLATIYFYSLQCETGISKNIQEVLYMIEVDMNTFSSGSLS